MTARTFRSALVIPFLTLCVAAHADAQEDAAAPKSLDQALSSLARSPAIAFATSESQDNAMMRQLRAMMPDSDQAVEVDGTLSDGLLHASLNVDEDEVVIHGGRMIARTLGGAWKLRHNALANGGALPFVFDPHRFCQVLGDLPARSCEVAHEEPTTYRKQELVIRSVTLEGEAAQDFNFSGAVPPVSGGGRMMMLGVGGMGRSDPPEMTVDLAFYVDPQGGGVRRIKVKSYQKSNMPAGMQVRFGGPDGEPVGAEDEDEPDVQEQDADGKRIYQRGLPVRTVDKTVSVMEFDVRFDDTGDKTATPALDDHARKLLGLPSGR